MSTTQTNDDTIDASVLLIDDDPEDIRLIEQILFTAPITIRVNTVRNGKAALEYLQATYASKDLDLPDLILLDLNMPVMDGNAFLKSLRSHPIFFDLPVCVITMYADDLIAQLAYSNGANAVVDKHEANGSMSTIVNAIVDSWFKSATRYYTG